MEPITTTGIVKGILVSKGKELFIKKAVFQLKKFTSPELYENITEKEFTEISFLDTFFYNKVYKFLLSASSGETTLEDKVKFLTKYNRNKTFYERVFLIISSMNNYDKVEMTGKLFACLLREEIETDEFFEIFQIIEFAFLSDLIKLQQEFNEDKLNGEFESKDKDYILRNIHTGIIIDLPLKFGADNYKLSDIGEKFLKLDIILKGDEREL